MRCLTNTFNKKCDLYHGASGKASGNLPECRFRDTYADNLRGQLLTVQVACKSNTSEVRMMARKWHLLSWLDGQEDFQKWKTNTL